MPGNATAFIRGIAFNIISDSSSKKELRLISTGLSFSGYRSRGNHRSGGSSPILEIGNLRNWARRTVRTSIPLRPTSNEFVRDPVPIGAW